MQSLLAIETPAELRGLLADRSAEEVVRIVEELGVDPVLDRVFAVMRERFSPERAAGVRAAIQWHVTAPDGARPYRIHVEEGRCRAERGRVEGPAHATLQAPVPTFLRVVAGLVHGVDAFARGELEVEGDRPTALLQQLWFDADLSETELQVATPRQLATLVAGRADDEIAAAIRVAGVQRVLDRVFQGMEEHFLPDKAGRRPTIVHFHVRAGGEEHVRQLTVSRSGARHRPEAPDRANVRITASMPEFMRLVAGELNGITAFAQGRIRVRGNLLTARKIPGWFDMSR